MTTKTKRHIKVGPTTSKEHSKHIDDDTLAHLKSLPAKGLVQYALEHHKICLKLDNGKAWLLKKVAYLEEAKAQGELLPLRVVARIAALDDPNKIKELQMEDQKQVKDTKVKGTKVKGTEIKDIKAKRDADGFRPSSKAAQCFAALKIGATHEDLAKITGSGVTNMLRWLALPKDLNNFGREAILVTDDKGIVRMASYKVEGKVVKVHD